MENFKIYLLRNGVIAVVDTIHKIVVFEFVDGYKVMIDLKNRRIWLDMDGTIAGLYAVLFWLPRIIAGDPSVFEDARPIVNMRRLVWALKVLLDNGYEIIIDSKLPKDCTEDMAFASAMAKVRWLHHHMGSVAHRLTLIFRGYYEIKGDGKGGLLFDDEERNRKSFIGYSLDADHVVEVLCALAELITKLN